MTLQEAMKRRKEIAKRCLAITDQAEAENRDLDRAERAEVAALEAEDKELRALEVPGPDPDPIPGTPGNPRTAPAFHQREQRDYSFLSLARGALALKHGNIREADALMRVERRASDEVRERLGRDPEHMFVPPAQLLPRDVRRKVLGLETRDITKATTGASLVGVDLLPQEFIEVLRKASVVGALGARIVDGLIGDVDLPRQSAAGTAEWLATETDDLTADTAFDTDEVQLRPKTVGIRHDISRRMTKQSSPGIEEIVREDILATIGLAIDEKALNGDGTGGTPTGIVNTTGVGAVDLTGGATWADIVEFESDVAAADALQGSLGYAVRPDSVTALKTTQKDAGSGLFLMDMDGTMNGYPVRRSNQLTATNPIIFGNWRDLLIGMWGALDFFPDPYTLGDRGAVVLRGFQDIDVALRHVPSFSVGA